MTQNQVVDLAIRALMLAAELAAPLLITALVVGFAISVFQSITQIQEATLSFVPKAIAVAIALVVCGHWMISEAVTFTQQLFAMIPSYLRQS
ncbi:flagellar biosynthesis protein FliQ [Amnibacterium kyonggiense]|jgi:flagellar biosynthesis protein FliQ|uniref:Flagellar biosynthetic protein FliQ n=1 Tax=Amnibacterium kyonggiense TaxID=595671 RepID=A0A4R7FQM2_9MICO|nr:flagellar biosynthesis protein FliQ [Amnibacterium kyonggiense]TDS80087.1 flagellar biosynthetic protein FliQ [Amnibacterium kyonggiense]